MQLPYHNRLESPTIAVVFDIRIPEAAARFHRERWAWAEAGDVEALDEHHYVLIVRPGAARERAA